MFCEHTRHAASAPRDRRRALRGRYGRAPGSRHHDAPPPAAGRASPAPAGPAPLVIAGPRRFARCERRTAGPPGHCGARDRLHHKRRATRMRRRPRLHDGHARLRRVGRGREGALPTGRPRPGSHGGLRRPPRRSRARVVARAACGGRRALGDLARTADDRRRHVPRVDVRGNRGRVCGGRSVSHGRAQPARPGRTGLRNRRRLPPPQLPRRRGRTGPGDGARTDDRRHRLPRGRGHGRRQLRRRPADARRTDGAADSGRLGLGRSRAPRRPARPAAP